MARFEISLPFILANEGGYVNHPNDRGGPTNFGITQKTARAHGYAGDMRAIPMPVVEKIYREGFWRFCNVNSQEVATKIFDMCVNFGLSAGTRLAQRMLNIYHGAGLEVDGKFGPLTTAAMNRAAPPEAVLKGLASVSEARYRDIVFKDPSQQVFLRGWLNRAAKLPTQV